MYNFIVCAIFRNESHILKEWIEHYLFHGVDHIFLVNDFSSDNFIDIISEYIDKNKVTLFNNDIIYDYVGRQNIIINKYFKNLLQISKWMSILDLDEFLYSPIDINLQNVLNKYDDYSLLLIEWVLFGSNGHITQPKSVVEGFTLRKQINKGEKNIGTKYIVKCNKVLNFDIHNCYVIGNTIKFNCDNNLNVDFVINHYVIQSYNWFINVKGTRGDINNYIQTQGFARDDTYFKRYDYKDVVDLNLYNQNKELINKLFNN